MKIDLTDVDIDLIQLAIETHVNSLDQEDKEDYGIRYALILKQLKGDEE